MSINRNTLLFFYSARRSDVLCITQSVIAILVGLLMHASVRADVYKYVDEKGVVYFTNQQPSADAQLVIQSSRGVSTSSLDGQNPQAVDGIAKNTVNVMRASPNFRAVQSNMTAASELFGIEAELLQAVVVTESAFNASAVSPKGAVGLMQVMPATARRYGVRSEPGLSVAAKLTDPQVNIHTGSRYLADLLRLFRGDTELAVAAYNAGEGAVVRAGNRIPNYKETHQYVKKVMSVYKVLKSD